MTHCASDAPFVTLALYEVVLRLRLCTVRHAVR